MPIEIPSSYNRRGPRYTGFEGHEPAYTGFESFGDLPKPIGPVVPRASIKTLEQARDYARAGYAASAARADRKTVARQAWTDAAKKYATAHEAASVAGVITAATTISRLPQVIEFLKAADAVADSAKKMDISASSIPTFNTGGGSSASAPDQYLPPLPSEGGGMGLPLKIGIAGGLGFALLALFGRSKKDTRGASRLMGFLEGNRTRRRKKRRGAKRRGRR